MYVDSRFKAGSMMMSVLIACATASCVTTEETSDGITGTGNADEGTVTQEAVISGLVLCTVNGSAPTDFCVVETGDTSVKTVTMRINENLSTIPPNLRLYEWDLKTEDGGIRVVNGCRSGQTMCVFEVRPECTREQTSKVILVTFRILNARSLATDQGVSIVGIANARGGALGCLLQRFSGCLSRPTGTPATTILSSYCGGQHRMYADLIPGQTYTQIQTKGSRTLSWSKVSDTYDFPGITVENQNGYCDGDSYGDFYARSRACNECGCGPWGPEAFFSYFPYECR